MPTIDESEGKTTEDFDDADKSLFSDADILGKADNDE